MARQSKNTQYVDVTFGEALNGTFKTVTYIKKNKEGDYGRETKRIKIPKGVYSGLSLEIDNNVEITFKVEETKKGLFKRYGDDIYTTLYVPEDFNGEIPYFSLDGIERIDISNSCQEQESLIKIKNKGFPVYGAKKKNKRGAFYVRIFKVFS